MMTMRAWGYVFVALTLLCAYLGFTNALGTASPVARILVISFASAAALVFILKPRSV